VTERVAVVGGGVAGITAAHILQRRFAVTLLEGNDYLGGHTHTIAVPAGPDAGTPVDTGFIVFNDRTYPLFTRLLGQLGVGWRATEMSFSLTTRPTGLCWAGNDLNGLFAQRRNIVRPSYLRMLTGITRFSREARAALAAGGVPAVSLGEYLRAGGYPASVARDYVLPMAAAIWSTPAGEVDTFPVEPFLRFFDNHGLLSLRDRPTWRTVEGGSQAYVDSFRRSFRGTILTSTPVGAIRREPGGVRIRTIDGAETDYDRVVVAAHADQALALLADPTDEEALLLGPWRYHGNRTVLHTDVSALPPLRRAWACWNYERWSAGVECGAVSVTYAMNLLQGLRTREQYCVSLNRPVPAAADRVLGTFDYAHPGYTSSSIGTQPGLRALRGANRTHFCGSYHGYGFHEDAVRSAVVVARRLELDL